MPREGVNEERMGKKKNMLKRNSGFIIGCVVAAGASFFTADVLTSDQKLLQIPQAEKMTETSDEPETVPEECRGDIVRIKAFSERFHEAEISQW